MHNETIMYASLAILGTIGSAFCAGAEMGLYSINRVRLSLRARAGERAALDLQSELEHPARLLAALLVAYNLFSYAGAVGVTELLKRAGYGEWQVVGITAVVLGPILFVIADGFPKEAFRAEADVLTYLAARPLRWLRLLLTYSGVLPLVQMLARVVSAALGGGEESEIPSARGKMAELLKEGAQHGVISEQQATLLDRAFALRETTVGDEMTPWSKVRWMSAEWNRARQLDYLSRNTLSRYPVLDARGQVVGVVSLVDICLRPDDPLETVVSKPVMIDEDASVRQGLTMLRDAEAALGIVTEKGRPVGIVTAKDLVEPLTGELKVF